MNTIIERPLQVSRAANTATAAVTQRQNRSLTQWLFNPFSICDTTNWAVSTGVGKLAIGGLTKVENIAIRRTPNHSKRNAYASTMGFDGNYIEEERFAFNIASEIEGHFPKQVLRVKALEGIDNDDVAESIAIALLGAKMQITEIEGATDVVPVLPAMLETLRINMRAISRGNSPQKELLLKVGKEFETAIAENIKYALNDLKAPQQDVAAGKRTGFDYNARRNFLALGKPVPDTLKFTDTNTTSESNAQLASAIDRLANLLGDAPKAETPMPDDFISEEFEAELLAEVEQAEETEEVETPTATANKCTALTSRKTACQNDALNGEFCRVHTKIDD